MNGVIAQRMMIGFWFNLEVEFCIFLVRGIVIAILIQELSGRF